MSLASSHLCWGPAKTMLSSPPGTESSRLGGVWILSPCSGSGREFSPDSSEDRKRKHSEPSLALCVTLTGSWCGKATPAGWSWVGLEEPCCLEADNVLSFLACSLSGMCCLAGTLADWCQLQVGGQLLWWRQEHSCLRGSYA